MPAEGPTMDDDVPEEPPGGNRQNYGYYHEVGGSTNLCKVIMALQLVSIPMLLDFTKHFSFMPQQFKLKTNTDCSWRVIVQLLNDRVTLDQGWTIFVAVHLSR
ncbi:Cohesin subunit SA-1 [Hordeum vulgare]|nr:Cohesin subunit SA-1 [Hordeum vulgare]